MIAMSNHEEHDLLDYLLGKCKAIVIDRKEPLAPFVEKMAQKGYLVNYDNIDNVRYYHVKESFRHKILSDLRGK